MLQELFCQGPEGKKRKFKDIGDTDEIKEIFQNDREQKERESEMSLINVIFFKQRVVALSLSSCKFRFISSFNFHPSLLAAGLVC